MKKIILILLLIVSLLGCQEKESIDMCSDYELEEATLTDSLDYEIINTIIDSIYSDFKLIHIVQEIPNTNINIEGLIFRFEIKNVEVDTILIQNYKLNNETSYLIADRFRQNNVQVIGVAELECLIDEENRDSWENYYTKYPSSSGKYRFKKPGYNIYKDKALIEYSWRAESLTGGGYIVLLEKVNGKWKITYYSTTWII